MIDENMGHMRIMIRVELTEAQQSALEPLFEKVVASNKEGKTCSIAAQVWRDGMVVTFLDEEKYVSLAAALGGGHCNYKSSTEFNTR